MKLIVLMAALTLALPATALAAADHRGEVHAVCAPSTWIEHGPADHPIAAAYKGDTFRVTRARYFVARHHAWAKGVLTHREAKLKRTFTHRGWIRVDALRGC